MSVSKKRAAPKWVGRQTKSVVISIIDRWLSRFAVPHDQRLQMEGAPAVVVLGGSTGIGLAIAREFHSQGEIVVLVARDREELDTATAVFPADEADGSRHYTLVLDVAEAQAPAALDALLRDKGLWLDVLVNSAAIGNAGLFEDQSVDGLGSILDLNIAALTRFCHHVLPGMKARARGGIMNLGSLGGYVPGPFQATYYASKAYVNSLTRALAAEAAGSGVRIVVVTPGPVETRFHAQMGAETSLYRTFVPSLSAERTARAAVFGYRLGRAIIVPGFVANALALAVTYVPNWVTVPIVKHLLDPAWRRSSPPVEAPLARARHTDKNNDAKKISSFVK